jgi:hypothetical protein
VRAVGAGEHHVERPELIFLFGSGEIPIDSGYSLQLLSQRGLFIAAP